MLLRGLVQSAAALLAAAVAFATPAAAVVGGAEDSVALAGASVMVLSSRGGMCSAVVVAPDVVVTAAHCVGGGESRVHYRDGGAEPVLIRPLTVKVHPGYDAGAIQARRRSIDLALVRLPAPLPARFGAAALTAEPARKGAALTLGGYGVAREGDMRSTGNFRTAALAVAEPYGPSRILVWATGRDGAKAGACHGDSGGPIADGAGAVLAVTSWVAGGAGGCGRMSQGILLGPQRGWLDGVLASWGRSAAWR